MPRSSFFSPLCCGIMALGLLIVIVLPPAVSPAAASRDGGGTYYCTLASAPLPGIDGTLSAGEWSAANSTQITLNGFSSPGRTITANWSYMSDGTDIHIALNFSVATDFLVLDIDDKEDHHSIDGGEDYVRVDSAYSDRCWSQTYGDWVADTSSGGTSDGAGKRSPDTRAYEVRKPLSSGDDHDLFASPGSTIGFRIETYSAGDYYRYPQDTVDHDLNFNGNLGDEMSAWMDLVLADVPNAPPALSGGGVTPAAGNVSTSFLYSVTYTDADDNTPACASVVIDGRPHAMVTADTGYTDGSIFTVSTTLKGGSHDYYFNFSDGRAVARLPASGALAGPEVEMPCPPTISNGTVGPASGTPDTMFRYSVRYNDTNGDPPVIHKVTIDGTSHDMSANGTDYRNGTGFTYETKLAAGSHTYSFFFDDATGSPRLPASGSYSGPEVAIPNRLPVLSNGKVSPSVGDEGGAFRYAVTYSDTDNDPPQFVNLIIDGRNSTPYAMAATDPLDDDFTDGKDYFYELRGSTALRGDASPHNFTFETGDRTGSERVSTSACEGPMVKWLRFIGVDSWRPDTVQGKVYLTGNYRTFLSGTDSTPPAAPEGKVPLGLAFVMNTTAPPGKWFYANITISYARLNLSGIDQTSLGVFWSVDGREYAPAPGSGLDVEGQCLWFNTTRPDAKFAVFGKSLLAELVIGAPRADVQRPAEGQKVTWTVTLANSGLAESRAADLAWVLDGAVVNSSTIPPILPGKSAQARWSWVAVRGNHTVEVRIGGASNFNLFEVAAGSPPVALIDGPASAMRGKAASFSAQRSYDPDGRIVRYLWDFGDGNGSEGANVTHIYSRAKSHYTVTLTVTDDTGANGTASHNISVKFPPAPKPPGLIPGFSGALLAAATAAVLQLHLRKREGKGVP